MTSDNKTKLETYKKIPFSPKSLIRVINGEIRELSYAFIWTSTPQGDEYWRRIYRRRGRVGRLSLDEETLSYLRWLEKGILKDKLDGYEE